MLPLYHLSSFQAVIRAILPTAEFSEDNEGQLIIYTGLRADEHGDLSEFVSKDTQS